MVGEEAGIIGERDLCPDVVATEVAGGGIGSAGSEARIDACLLEDELLEDALVAADAFSELDQFAEGEACVVFEECVVGLGIGVAAAFVGGVFHDIGGVFHEGVDAGFLSFGDLLGAESDEGAIFGEVAVDDGLGVIEEFAQVFVVGDIDGGIGEIS